MVALQKADDLLESLGEYAMTLGDMASNTDADAIPNDVDAVADDPEDVPIFLVVLLVVLVRKVRTADILINFRQMSGGLHSIRTK